MPEPPSPFLQAVAAGKYAEARALLAHGADAQARWGGEDPALSSATALTLSLGYYDCYLLDERSPGRAFDHEFLSLLKRSGVDVNAPDESGRTPLHRAPAQGPQRGFLLVQGADPNLGDCYGMTPLHQAAKFGGTAPCEDLLRHGARLEQKDHYGHTPLLLAASEGFPDTVRALLRAGANLQAHLPDGTTALHLAASSVQYQRIVQTLKVLIEAGLQVDVTNALGLTALHCAALKEFVDPVRFLLANGADPNAADRHGAAPLHTGSAEACQELLRQGARVNQADAYGYTPLHRAAERARPDLVRLLIMAGANVAARTLEGLTALHLAAGSGYAPRVVPTLEVLIEFGAPVNATDGQGATGLHHAARHGLADAVRFLQTHGATKSVRNADGQTPLDLARHFKLESVIQSLQT